MFVCLLFVCGFIVVNILVDVVCGVGDECGCFIGVVM